MRAPLRSAFFFPQHPFTLSTMSCCGSPKDAPPVQNNLQNQWQQPGTINTQPGYHPGLEKPQTFQQPNLAQPPQAYANNFNTGNGLQSPPPGAWNPTPSPPPQTTDFASLNGHSSPLMAASTGTGTYAGTTLNGSNFSSNTAFSPQNGMQQLPKAPTPAMTITPNRGFSPPPQPQIPSMPMQSEDDGKLSISIDFGTTFSGVVSPIVLFCPR